MLEITITLDSSDLVNAVGRVITATQRMKPVFAQFGEYQLGEVENRFESESDPDGQPWVDLAPSTWKRKKNNKILTETTRLRGSFSYDADDNSLSLGTPVSYAAVHEFGATIQIQPREAEVYFKLGRDGRPKRKFTKRQQSDFAQRVRMRGYTVRIPPRPFLDVNDAGVEYLADLVVDHLGKAARG